MEESTDDSVICCKVHSIDSDGAKHAEQWMENVKKIHGISDNCRDSDSDQEEEKKTRGSSSRVSTSSLKDYIFEIDEELQEIAKF